MCDRKIDECLVWVSWEDLETVYKLPYARQHVLERMVPKGQFPQPFRLGSGEKCRIAWRLCDYKEWAATRPLVPFVIPEDDDDTAPTE
jgi:predicted DNA-binding transcriptional regulator AlpA